MSATLLVYTNPRRARLSVEAREAVRIFGALDQDSRRDLLLLMTGRRTPGQDVAAIKARLDSLMKLMGRARKAVGQTTEDGAR